MKRQSGVFVMKGDDELISMEPAEFEKEDDFQTLLQKFPALLVGDQIEPENPRRWVLVKREKTVSINEPGSSSWSIDHLFLDQDGIPTLVEVKRQSDTRIRREVVGQMLDYAASCANWSIGVLQSDFVQTCEAVNRVPSEVLLELIGDEEAGEAEFWERVRTNLAAGRVRLLFVADVVPIELRRIVEFLNRQMSPAEVLAIELRQFRSEGLRTIVPVIFGQTTAKATAGKEPGQRWDQQRFFDKLELMVGQNEVKVAERVFEWMKADGRVLIWGNGKENGSVYPLFRPNGIRINPAYLATDGKLWLQFAPLENKPVFYDVSRRRELIARFGAINGVTMGESDLTGYRAIPLAQIAADPDGLLKVLGALQWMADQIVAAPKGPADT